MAKKNNKRKSRTREPLEDYEEFESEQVVEQPRSHYKTVLSYLLDQDEVNNLIAASCTEYVDPNVPNLTTDYSTYSEEEVVSLIQGDFRPRKTKKK